ncbi:GntR family transcriptional regulator [Labrys wisconsinensis]|uniref:DNA-binding GntR family transcriptional regulator n=1 Tax=Labrys wisconsinensis TaxID=425677 RepID=A0ABU0J0G6_9HYPH|nr:GntR family transcriptional regulator [Labrys wisconsinensis]MDQ0467750.1 DNA-binding GntR family transcriptional regulator [Labrys wisconsinensis]
MTASSGALSIDRPRSLTATVAERLRQAIIDSELPLGSELSEVGLAAKLGVSRTPVREALSMLQLQGMVNIVPQKGSYVFFPTEQDILDLCEYRIVIELRAVSFSLARRREATLAMLHEALAAMTAARGRGDPVAYSRADTLFHEAFIRNCRNRYLEEGYALAAGPIATLRTHLSVPLAGVQDRSYVEHQEIAEGFARGDVVAIESILVRHILGTRESYVRALQQGIIASRPGE